VEGGLQPKPKYIDKDAELEARKRLYHELKVKVKKHIYDNL
jgi:hypothetical protein